MSEKNFSNRDQADTKWYHLYTNPILNSTYGIYT